MISLSSPTFYKNGEAGQSQVVGFESLVTRVARFAFVTPPQGADTVSFEFEGVEKGAGYDIGLRWHITADPASHANAGASAAYAGQVTLSGRWGRGEGQLLLLPNTTYYLWLFPGEDLWGWYYWPVKGQLTLSGASQSIPSLSHTTAALGQTVRITTNRMGDFTHTLTWQLGSGSGTIAENVTDLYDWLLPEELALQLPNAASGILTLACQSYAAGTAVGAPQSVSLTVTVPQSLAPQVSFTWQDTSPAGALGVPVQNVSALALDISADARYGAGIVARAASLDGAAYTGGVLTAAGDHTLTVTVTDSRGLTAAASRTVSVAAYAAPTLELSASRCLADGTADDTGSFARVKLTGEVTPIADKNTAALTLYWGSEWEEIPVAPGSIAAERILPADANSTLAIRAALSDALRSASRSMTLSTGFATVDFLSGGRGIAFGQVATREGFTCAMPVYLEGSRLTGLPAPADSTDAVPKGYADKLRAVNLLDNSDFRNPVNQRGKTGYAGDAYTIDRWSVWAVDGDGTLTVNPGYISFNGGANGGTFTQRFQRGILDSGKTYTMAYQKLSGEIAVFPAAIDYNFLNSCDLLTLCNTQNKTEDMVWAALYEGEYTAETLPEYQPKGYGAELAACQRYYMNFHNLRFNLMYCTDGTYRGAYLLPCSMRITPTVSYGTKGDSDGIVLELVTPNGFSVYAANVTTAYLQLENVLCSADL